MISMILLNLKLNMKVENDMVPLMKKSRNTTTPSQTSPKKKSSN